MTRASEAGWKEIINVDGRRGLWIRTRTVQNDVSAQDDPDATRPISFPQTVSIVEMCGGREGDDYYVRLDSDARQRSVVENMVGALRSARETKIEEDARAAAKALATTATTTTQEPTTPTPTTVDRRARVFAILAEWLADSDVRRGDAMDLVDRLEISLNGLGEMLPIDVLDAIRKCREFYVNLPGRGGGNPIAR